MRSARSVVPPWLCVAVAPLLGACGATNASAPDAGSADLAPVVHHAGPARSEPGFGYDPGTNRVVAFGGDDGAEVAATLVPRYHDDTRLYDVAGGSWSLSSAKGPSARGRPAAAMDTARGRLVVAFGRYRDAGAGTKASVGYTLPTDAWAYDVANDAWTMLPASGAPAGRSGPAAVWDAARDRLVVFGGNLGTRFDVLGGFVPTDETWQLAAGAWTKLAPTGAAPAARYLAGATLDTKRDRMLVFGGCCDAMGGFFSDVWALDLSTDTWSLVMAGEDAVSDRLGAGAAYLPAGDALVVFGGHDLSSIGHVNDTWLLPLGVAPLAWKPLYAGDRPNDDTLGCAGNATEAPYDFVTTDGASPERRERALFVYAGGPVVLAGGEGDCGQLDDTWLLGGGPVWTRAIAAAQGESCARRGDQCPCLCE